MIKKSCAALAMAGCLVLAGCSSVTQSYDGFNAAVVDPYVKTNETTLAEVRALLGTPTVLGTTKDGFKVAGFGFSGNNIWGGIGRGTGRYLVTLGLGARSYEYTVKALLFKFDENDRVIDYQKTGASYLTKHRFGYWNECERKLTMEEINSPTVYRISEVCPVYAQEVAAKKGIAVSEVDIDEEFPFCNIPCQTLRGVIEKFGELTEYTDLVKSEEGDGDKKDLIAP